MSLHEDHSVKYLQKLDHSVKLPGCASLLSSPDACKHLLPYKPPTKTSIPNGPCRAQVGAVRKRQRPWESESESESPSATSPGSNTRLNTDVAPTDKAGALVAVEATMSYLGNEETLLPTYAENEQRASLLAEPQRAEDVVPSITSPRPHTSLPRQDHALDDVTSAQSADRHVALVMTSRLVSLPPPDLSCGRPSSPLLSANLRDDQDRPSGLPAAPPENLGEVPYGTEHLGEAPYGTQRLLAVPRTCPGCHCNGSSPSGSFPLGPVRASIILTKNSSTPLSSVSVPTIQPNHDRSGREHTSAVQPQHHRSDQHNLGAMPHQSRLLLRKRPAASSAVVMSMVPATTTTSSVPRLHYKGPVRPHHDQPELRSLGATPLSLPGSAHSSLSPNVLSNLWTSTYRNPIGTGPYLTSKASTNGSETFRAGGATIMTKAPSAPNESRVSCSYMSADCLPIGRGMYLSSKSSSTSTNSHLVPAMSESPTAYTWTNCVHSDLGMYREANGPTDGAKHSRMGGPTASSTPQSPTSLSLVDSDVCVTSPSLLLAEVSLSSSDVPCVPPPAAAGRKPKSAQAKRSRGPSRTFARADPTPSQTSHGLVDSDVCVTSPSLLLAEGSSCSSDVPSVLPPAVAGRQPKSAQAKRSRGPSRAFARPGPTPTQTPTRTPTAKLQNRPGRVDQRNPGSAFQQGAVGVPCGDLRRRRQVQAWAGPNERSVQGFFDPFGEVSSDMMDGIVCGMTYAKHFESMSDLSSLLVRSIGGQQGMRDVTLVQQECSLTNSEAQSLLLADYRRSRVMRYIQEIRPKIRQSEKTVRYITRSDLARNRSRVAGKFAKEPQSAIDSQELGLLHMWT